MGLYFGGHENVSNFCFARFAPAKESTVLNGKKNLVGLAFAQFWAGVWPKGKFLMIRNLNTPCD
jgi:hypothetical protein